MQHRILNIPTALAIGLLGLFDPGLAGPSPIEVGAVEWTRDFDGALEQSAQTGKPVFAFFQEVPGCSGCKKFGAEVMSQNAIVEAVKREFLPVLIYNNRGGEDAAILKRYGEPAWNYQVIRFLDGKGKDLIPRKDRVWTRSALASRMIDALDAAGRVAPRYLEVVAHEGDTEHHDTVAFAQSCFWSGEVALGQVSGVVATEAGWLEGREVTLVTYHPGLLSLETLAGRARAAGVSGKLYSPVDSSYRQADASDQKRQIRNSVFDRIDLSPMQRTKVNAFATIDMPEALAWLTPKQREKFERLSAER